MRALRPIQPITISSVDTPIAADPFTRAAKDILTATGHDRETHKVGMSRDSPQNKVVEAHLTIVFTALALPSLLQDRNGPAIRTVVGALRPLRSTSSRSTEPSRPQAVLPVSRNTKRTT